MFVNRRATGVTRWTSTALRGPSGAAPSGGHAGEPGVRRLELGPCGQRLRGGPGPVETLDAGALDDGVAERLARLVLAHLHLEAQQLLEHAPQRRAVAAAALQRAPQLLEVGEDGDTRGV